MKGFLEFIREQGIIGLAVGIILGGAISKMVSSIVNDLVSPILGILLGSAEKLSDMVLLVGKVEIRWGSFLNSFIDFISIAIVIYVFVKLLRLDRLDKKKS